MRKKGNGFGKFLLSIILATSMFFLAALSDLDSSMMYVLLDRTRFSPAGMLFDGLHVFTEDVEDNSSNNGAVSYDGLNYALIDQLSNSYVKNLLKLYQSSASGELDNFKSHVTVTGLLTTQVSSTGYYPNTALPLSYLPFENNKVIWGEPYKGVSKDDMTLRTFGTQQYRKIGGEEYNQLMNEKPARKQAAPKRTPWAIDVTAFSASGTRDFRNLPDCLSYLNQLYVESLKAHGIEDDLALASRDTRIGDALFAAGLELGKADAVKSAFGILDRRTNTKRLDMGKKGSGEMSILAYNSILSLSLDFLNGYQKDQRWQELSPDEFIADAAVVLACRNNGWFLSRKAYDSIGESTFRVWKLLYADDTVASVADCKAIAETKVKDLQEAITATTGVPVSKKDTQKVYGTRTDYDDAAGDNNGFIYHVSENECSLYTRSYDDSTAPSLVSVYDRKVAGKIIFTCAMGEVLYVNLLKAGGLTNVDVTDPSTYKNEVVNSGNKVSNGNLNSIYSKAGLDSTMLSAERIAVLNNAASMLGKACYTWGGGHGGYGIGETPSPASDGMYDFDCSGFVSWCFMKEGYLSSQRVSNGYAPDFYLIDYDELLPGDIFSCSGHVMIYVNTDSKGNCWVIDDGGGGPGTYHVYVEGEVGVRFMSKSLPVKNKNGRVIKTSGGRTDNRVYVCMRAKSFDKTDTKRKTYIPSGNSGAR